jgi:hypothetical protein
MSIKEVQFFGPTPLFFQPTCRRRIDDRQKFHHCGASMQTWGALLPSRCVWAIAPGVALIGAAR